MVRTEELWSIKLKILIRLKMSIFFSGPHPSLHPLPPCIHTYKLLPRSMLFSGKHKYEKHLYIYMYISFELAHSISYMISCALSAGSQPAHLHNLIRFFSGHFIGSHASWPSSARHWRLIRLDVQSDLSLAVHTCNLVGKTVPRLIYNCLFFF